MVCASPKSIRDSRTRLCFREDRKSTRLNSSHVSISYAVFCLKKKNNRYEGHTHLLLRDAMPFRLATTTLLQHSTASIKICPSTVRCTTLVYSVERVSI